MKTVMSLGAFGLMVCMAFAGEAAGVISPSVEVEVRIFEVDENTLRNDVNIAELDDAAIQKLSTRKDADMLYLYRSVVPADQECQVKSVTEYVYPTEYGIRKFGSTNETTGTLPVALEPMNNTMREAGSILQFIPKWDSENEVICINFRAQVVSEPGWKKIPFVYLDKQGEKHEFSGEQPIFSVRDVQTILEMRDGGSMSMIIGRMNHGEKKGPTLGFAVVKASLVKVPIKQPAKQPAKGPAGAAAW